MMSCSSSSKRIVLCAIKGISFLAVFIGLIILNSQIIGATTLYQNDFESTLASQSYKPLKNDFLTQVDYQLSIFAFSHDQKPIYANYTKITYRFLLEGSGANLSQVTLSYSQDQSSWSAVIIFNKSAWDNNDTAYFKGTIGPFAEVGYYYLKVNATLGGEDITALYTRIEVEPITGLKFTNFQYRFKTFSDGKTYFDVFIDILGDNLAPLTVNVLVDKQDDNYPPERMNPVVNTSFTFRATNIGPTNSWDGTIFLTFQANTTSGEYYNNTDYFITISESFPPENFLTSQLPALLVSLFSIGSVGTVFVLNRMSRRGK
jgi:hypothetical protein